MKRPEVEKVEGLSPSIALIRDPGQKSESHRRNNNRDLWLFKIVFARVGKTYPAAILIVNIEEAFFSFNHLREPVRH